MAEHVPYILIGPYHAATLFFLSIISQNFSSSHPNLDLHKTRGSVANSSPFCVPPGPPPRSLNGRGGEGSGCPEPARMRGSLKGLVLAAHNILARPAASRPHLRYLNENCSVFTGTLLIAVVNYSRYRHCLFAAALFWTPGPSGSTLALFTRTRSLRTGASSTSPSSAPATRQEGIFQSKTWHHRRITSRFTS